MTFHIYCLYLCHFLDQLIFNLLGNAIFYARPKLYIAPYETMEWILVWVYTLPTIISVYQSILRQIWTGTIIRCQAASISYEEKNIFKKPRVYRNYVLLYEWQLQHQQKQKKEFFKEGYYYYAPIHKRISYTSFFLVISVTRLLCIVIN